MLPMLLASLLDTLFLTLDMYMRESRYRIFMNTWRVALVAFTLLMFLGNFHYFYVKYYYLIGRLDERNYIISIAGFL